MPESDGKYRWSRDHYIYYGILDLGRVEQTKSAWRAVAQTMAGETEVAIVPTEALARAAVERWVEHESDWDKST